MFHFPRLKENWLQKIDGICLINQVRSRMFPYTSQTAEEASFQLPSIYLFSVTFHSPFFQLPYLEHDLMITNSVRLNLIF